ncbi:MAG: hypothetical protein OEZ19_07295, partial [Paracoccaceae bacterium]|nr:hypothetical protein [Paracoccaceae bacterium]
LLIARFLQESITYRTGCGNALGRIFKLHHRQKGRGNGLREFPAQKASHSRSNVIHTGPIRSSVDSDGLFDSSEKVGGLP